MPGYEGRSRRGLISLDIERSIAILSLITMITSHAAYSHAAGDRERPISAWVELPLAVVDRRHGHCPEPPSLVADPAFVPPTSTTILSPTRVQGSVTPAASLSPC